MEDNENDIDIEDLYYQSDRIQNNTFENNLQNYSELNPQYSSIKKKETTFQMNSIKTIKEMLDDIKIPYPNNDEIPLINIKDENYFENGNNIENYIKSLIKFEHNKFNICRICFKEQNKYYCHNCNHNICDKCYKICHSNSHILFNLKNYLKEVEKNKLDIKVMISNYILSKEKKDYDLNEKKNKNYEIMDELEMNNEIEEKPMDYTYDIILIEAIIEQNYINYFHYINIKNCLYYLRNKYKDYVGFIKINYKVEKNNTKIKLFGYMFVLNNENNCHIIYEDKNYKLMEFLEIKQYEKDKILEIELIGINNIIKANDMFYGCISLVSLYDISVKNMSYMFFGWESLISLPDISKWNTNNVIDMSHMFEGCTSLLLLPDISKWNTNNVTNMSEMFERCTSLKSLPDISKWNTNNVIDMSEMFSGCKSLISLPDISKWNTNNVKNISYMFSLCKSLISLPDISSWNVNNVKNISFLFSSCKSLISLPDISKWNVNNEKDMSYMFRGCESLISLPDISKWNTNNVKNMSEMFSGCKSLISLPDISKWKLNNALYMSCMFYECQSLISLPDISKWIIKKVIYKSDMFYGCISLQKVGRNNFFDFFGVWEKY